MIKRERGFFAYRVVDRCSDHPDYCRYRYSQPTPVTYGRERILGGWFGRTINTAAVSPTIPATATASPALLAEIGTTGTAAASCNNAEYLDPLLTTRSQERLQLHDDGRRSGTCCGIGSFRLRHGGLYGRLHPSSLTAKHRHDRADSLCADATGVIRYNRCGHHNDHSSALHGYHGTRPVAGACTTTITLARRGEAQLPPLCYSRNHTHSTNRVSRLL